VAGSIASYFHQIGGSNEPLIRQMQYDAFRDEAKLEYLRKWIASEKIETQIQLFKELVADQKDTTIHTTRNGRLAIIRILQ
jgi:hypothetical protein